MPARDFSRKANLLRVDGRRMLFDLAAHDEFEKTAEGENQHLLFSVYGFLPRVRRKTAKAKSIQKMNFIHGSIA
jgi:predicted thioesterase